jgi:hypothetical protein
MTLYNLPEIEEDPDNVLETLLLHLGVRPTLQLCYRFGGASLYIPADIRPDHRLCRLLKSDSCAQLAALYGGQHIFVPSLDDQITAAHGRMIAVNLAARGIKKSTISIALGRSVRTIERWLQQ